MQFQSKVLLNVKEGQKQNTQRWIPTCVSNQWYKQIRSVIVLWKKKKLKNQTQTKNKQTKKNSKQTFLYFLCLLLRFVLKGFTPEGRDLSDKETKALLAAGDKDGDGKIGADGM